MLNDKNAILSLESARAIKAIGSPAEKAVQPYAGPIGPAARPTISHCDIKAIGLLGDIGTAESVPPLQSMTKDPNSTIASSPTTAVAAIQAAGRSELTPFAQDQPAIDPRTRRGLPVVAHRENLPHRESRFFQHPQISSRVKWCSVKRAGVRLWHRDVAGVGSAEKRLDAGRARASSPAPGRNGCGRAARTDRRGFNSRWALAITFARLSAPRTIPSVLNRHAA